MQRRSACCGSSGSRVSSPVERTRSIPAIPGGAAAPGAWRRSAFVERPPPARRSTVQAMTVLVRRVFIVVDCFGEIAAGLLFGVVALIAIGSLILGLVFVVEGIV